MKKKSNLVTIILLSVCLLISFSNFAQITKINGKITDENNQAMPFVNVKFINSNIGTITDFDGNFNLETKWATDSLKASFLGYKETSKRVVKNSNQTLNFKLKPTSIRIHTVDIIDTKKVRYKNKGNPAVELIRNVIQHKENNHKHTLPFYEYDKYEKVQFDLTNFSEDIADKKIMKPFKFVFDSYVDTSEISGKPFIPFFIRESVSKMYFRKDPESKKEYLFGRKMSGHLNRFDSDGIGFLMKKL